MLGSRLGNRLGSKLGLRLGLKPGKFVGPELGKPMFAEDSRLLGSGLCFNNGTQLGERLKSSDGSPVEVLGYELESTKFEEGLLVGNKLDTADGIAALGEPLVSEEG